MKTEYLERLKILKTVCNFCENKHCLLDNGFFPCSLRVALECMDADLVDEKEKTK